MAFGGGTSGGGSIAGSSDVSLDGLQHGQALAYDGNVGKWHNGEMTAGVGFHRWESGDATPSPVLEGTYWIVLDESESIPGWVPAGSLVTRFVEG